METKQLIKNIKLTQQPLRNHHTVTIFVSHKTINNETINTLQQIFEQLITYNTNNIEESQEELHATDASRLHVGEVSRTIESDG